MSQNPLTPADLSAEFREAVSVQNYSPAPRIDGVRLIDLRAMADDGGSFTELGRLTEGGQLLGVDGFAVRQINYSELMPGAVKAWHLHFRQEDLWYVPPGERLLVGLRDLRQDSPTTGQSMRFIMGAGRSQLLLIPRGVAHGAANPWTQRTLMIYFVNQHFTTQDTDERRLPWDAFGSDFWSIQKG